MADETNLNENIAKSPADSDLYFIGVCFKGGNKSYYFSTTFSDFKPGDLVVVETASGYEMGTVTTNSKSMSLYHSNLELKPILRKPNKGDMSNYSYNQGAEKRALEVAAREIKALGLPMDLVDAVYTLDGNKVTITYTSPQNYVDFRELLRVLNPELDARVELRQIAARDKAKMIGGIGICGLPLCCSTFLSAFENISISRAKNQMLSLKNISKISGPCEKLICCLAYEDDAYTQAKKEFPRFGSVIHTPEGDYNVDGINILSRTVRLANATRDDYKTYPLEDVLAMQRGDYKPHEVVKPIDREAELPDFGIGVKDASYGGMHPDANDKGNYAKVAPKEDTRPSRNDRQQGRHGNRNDRHNRHDNRDRRDNQPRDQHNRNPQGQNENQNPRQDGQNNNRHNRHRHHRYNNNRGGNNQGGGNQ